jgi:hypothetical protein
MVRGKVPKTPVIPKAACDLMIFHNTKFQDPI